MSKVALYIAPIGGISNIEQRDYLCRIAIYERKGFRIYTETDIMKRPVRAEIISELKDKTFESIYVYNIFCLSNNLEDFLFLIDFFFKKKLGFYLATENTKYSPELGYHLLLESLYDMMIYDLTGVEEPKEPKELFSIEDNTIGRVCEAEDDKPHSV